MSYNRLSLSVLPLAERVHSDQAQQAFTINLCHTIAYRSLPATASIPLDLVVSLGYRLIFGCKTDTIVVGGQECPPAYLF